ncbi:hypothetical protein [Gardnerella leopoldii]|uniref:hypothetical protein n=1 Tax=Gardnerella leopoldii TaxID=2792978 RepID=UPI00157350D8|nr:hypothetical protein [Gardnerella vaginalis]
MKKNSDFLYYCVSTVVLICWLTTWVVYVCFVVDTAQNSGFSLQHVASSAISTITKPHTRNADDILSQAGRAYKDVLTNLNGKYKFGDADKYYYSLWDINNDKIPELIVTAAKVVDPNCSPAQNGETCENDRPISARLFSYDGKKLVIPSTILSYGTNFGTMFFDKNHDGIVFLENKVPDGGYSEIHNWSEDPHFPWKKTIYKLQNNDFVKKTYLVEYPIDTNLTKGSNELGKVTAPNYLKSDDLSEINKLINITKLTSKERQHEAEVLKWREKGYQVFDGTISSENEFIFTKRLLIVTNFHGTESGFSAPGSSVARGLILQGNSEEDNSKLDAYFSKYAKTGDKFTIAIKDSRYCCWDEDLSGTPEAFDAMHIIP